MFYSEDRSWFSLWNLPVQVHTRVISMLYVALQEAGRRRYLPVISDEDLIDDAEHLFTGAPSPAETILVTATIKALLSRQAVPPHTEPLVKLLLKDAIDMLCDYSSAGGSPSHWEEGDFTCETYGLVGNYDSYLAAYEYICNKMYSYFFECVVQEASDAELIDASPYSI